MQNCLNILNCSLFYLQTHKYTYIQCVYVCVCVHIYLHPHQSIIWCDIKWQHHDTFSPFHPPKKKKLKNELIHLTFPLLGKQALAEGQPAYWRPSTPPSLPAECHLALLYPSKLPWLWPFAGWFFASQQPGCLSLPPSSSSQDSAFAQAHMAKYAL